MQSPNKSLGTLVFTIFLLSLPWFSLNFRYRCCMVDIFVDMEYTTVSFFSAVWPFVSFCNLISNWGKEKLLSCEMRTTLICRYKNVLVWVTIAMMKHHDQNQVGKKRVIWLMLPLKEVRTGTQIKNLEARAGAEGMEEHYLWISSSWLGQPALLCPSGSPVQGQHHINQ